MQLQLFRWDLIEAGNGLACLARFDFEQAEVPFTRVFGSLFRHQIAGAGLRSVVQYWQQALRGAEGVDASPVYSSASRRLPSPLVKQAG